MNKIIIATITLILLSACSSSKVTNTESVMPVSVSASAPAAKANAAMTEKEKAKAKEEAIARLTAIAIKRLNVQCEKTANTSSRVKKRRCTTPKQREQAKLDAQEIYRLSNPLMGLGGDN